MIGNDDYVENPIVSNPIHAFCLVKRLIKDWEKLIKITSEYRHVYLYNIYLYFFLFLKSNNRDGNKARYDWVA